MFVTINSDIMIIILLWNRDILPLEPVRVWMRHSTSVLLLVLFLFEEVATSYFIVNTMIRYY